MQKSNTVITMNKCTLNKQQQQQIIVFEKIFVKSKDIVIVIRSNWGWSHLDPGDALSTVIPESLTDFRISVFLMMIMSEKIRILHWQVYSLSIRQCAVSLKGYSPVGVS